MVVDVGRKKVCHFQYLRRITRDIKEMKCLRGTNFLYDEKIVGTYFYRFLSSKVIFKRPVLDFQEEKTENRIWKMKSEKPKSEILK